ncbi:hypothetical protein [Hansschlegelia sp.]|uniref:hypothetical protein n=1 Tax=Hansschlegelia sp. TaxID=2041892 RepID=UPI002CC4A430|nr:hypothetical protein [Hansschlegelia sp.]HVI27515.1 hypothetical protein [Hansschlegelia sp.]
MQTVGQASKSGYRWLRVYLKVPNTSSYAYSISLSERPDETSLLDWAKEIELEKRRGDLIEVSVVNPERIEDPDPDKFELRVWHALS